MNERIRALFEGSVQGVGFRYTTARIAINHPVTGYVRNLSDGRVELVVEGPTQAARDVIDEIRQAMAGCIRSADLQPAEPTGEFDDFRIRP